MRFHKSIAVHPGVWVKDELINPGEVDRNILAKCLGIEFEVLEDFLEGKYDLTPQILVGLSTYFKSNLDFLTRMQDVHNSRKYDA